MIDAPSVPAGPVRVLGEGGRFLGLGLWSPRSQISLRMLTPEDRPIDRDFWLDRMMRARRYRESLHIDGTAYRLIHGEADGLPSLIADRYGDVVVVQLLSAGLEACRAGVVDALLEVFTPEGLLARNDVAVRRTEGLPEVVELLHGHVPDELRVCEGAICYRAAPVTGQKTGAFLDQRENRMRVGELARGRALDCFSYHGSFALHLARTSEQVVALDSSAPALERARANAALNGLNNMVTVEANVFDYLREQEAERARYDIIVLDPPAFAKRRAAIERAVAAYKEINLRAMKLLAEGGLLATFSCSHHVDPWVFRELLESAATDARRPIRWIETRGQALDHPEILQIPETSYLKGAILQAL